MASRPVRALWIATLVAVGLLWWLVLGRAGSPQAPQAPRPRPTPVSATVRPPSDDAGVALPVAGLARRPEPPPAPVTAALPCAPRAGKACNDGDVYWFDSCGKATDRVEDCAGRACLGISCALRDPVQNHCGAVTGYGDCDGTTARACVAGRVLSIDCAAHGERCVSTREGVQCLPPSKDACSGAEPARCDGTRLMQCVDGRMQAIECAFRNAACVAHDGVAQCIGSGWGSGSAGPMAPTKVEICNRLDDDADSKIDEDAVCDAVTLVPVVPAGMHLSNLAERMQDELAILNRIEQPISFRWDTVFEARAELGSSPARDMLGAAREVNAELGIRLGAGFRIPVLFVEQLGLRPPKAGMSTLPNNRCGGIRVDDRPAPTFGLIVLADQRTPQTLAHELGHYLGLCHTHEQLEAYATLDASTPWCQRGGDGICDTPTDPGSDVCSTDAACVASCDRGRPLPDPSNIMSYYFDCRRALSAEQMREVERNLSLRRGWARCLDARACPCQPGNPSDCPIEMSCRPGADDEFSCGLDGPAQPGAVCRDNAQCSLGSLCLNPAATAASQGRCVRACVVGAMGCDCTDVGLAFGVCAQDLSG